MIGTLRTCAAAALIVIGVSGVSASASTVIVHTAEQVLANSDAVFQGGVVGVSSRWAGAAGGAVLTDYTVAVYEVLNDDTGLIAERRKPDGTIVLTFAGGTMGDLNHTIAGVPQFSVGDRAFWLLRRADFESTSPITGVWQGLYRVRAVGQGGSVVYGPTGRPLVASPFAAKPAAAVGEMDLEKFEAEIREAIPRLRSAPELRFETIRARTGGLPNGASDHTTIQVGGVGEVGGAGPVTGANALHQSVEGTLGPANGVSRPWIGSPTWVDSSSDVNEVRPPIMNRAGYYRAPPDTPWVFNVAPNMGDFDLAFRLSMSYWNLKTIDPIFQVYQNNTNTTSYGNDRNEAVFLADAGLTNVQGRAWNGSELALCSALSRGGEIKEADIYFNLNPGMQWTNDLFTAHVSATNNPNNPVVYFPMVALHELGHSFGLDHQWLPNPGATYPSVMNYFASNLGYSAGHVFADDFLGIQAGYPGVPPAVDGGIWMMYQSGAQDTDLTNISSTAIAQGTSVQRGTNMAVGSGTRFFTVDNAGAGSFQARVDFFLCPIFGSFDGSRYCGSSTLPNMPQGSSGRFQRSVPIPANLAPGAYYLAAALEFDAETFYPNNYAWNHWPVTVTAARPPNDGSALAITIDPRGSTTVGTTTGATASNFGACGSSAASPDVWYVFTAPHDGALKLDTCGTGYDSVLELFQNAPSGASLICDDDDDLNRGPCNSASSRTSYILRTVTRGTRYWVRVSGYNGASGDFTLHANLNPANDTCDRPLSGFPGLMIATATLPAEGGVSAGTTVGAFASVAGSLPACPGYGPNGDPVSIEHLPDVWYWWTSPCSGLVRAYVITTENFAPQVAVYDRCVNSTITPPVMVACGFLSGPGQASVDFNAVAGRTYRIRVWTGNSVGGDFQISINHFCAPENDGPGGAALPGAQIMVGPDGAVARSLSTVAATGTVGLPIPEGCSGLGEFDPGPDLWFDLEIGVTGRLEVTRCNGDYLPVVALYNVMPSAGDSPAACGYDPAGGCEPVLISRDVVAGESFLVRVGGNPAGAGAMSGFTTLTFAVTPPTLLGACCAPDGGCALTAGFDCAGSYQGDDTVCDPTPCLQPTGACCTGTVCGILTEADCAAAAGTFLGVSSGCVDEPGNAISCCPANINRLGGLSVQDIFDFLAAYFSQAPEADFNRSGSTSVQDIFDFLAAWFLGCA